MGGVGGELRGYASQTTQDSRYLQKDSEKLVGGTGIRDRLLQHSPPLSSVRGVSATSPPPSSRDGGEQAGHRYHVAMELQHPRHSHTQLVQVQPGRGRGNRRASPGNGGGNNREAEYC